MVYPWESFTCTWEECVFCCSQLFYILLFCFSCLRCIYSNSYCLLDEFFPYHYILSILSFVAFYFFSCLDVYFVWYEYGYAHFLLAEFVCTVIFYSFIIRLHLSLGLKWVFRRKCIVGFFVFFFQSTQSFCFFLLVNSIHLHLE